MVHDGLIITNKMARIVIPSTLRLSILDQLHSGHQGATKCRVRAQQTVWWPGLSSQIQDLVHNCSNVGSRIINHPTQKLSLLLNF